MKRIEENRKIVQKLAEMIEHCPETRFIQLLWALNIVSSEDRFYEESSETLEKMMENVDKIY